MGRVLKLPDSPSSVFPLSFVSQHVRTLIRNVPDGFLVSTLRFQFMVQF